MPTIKREGFRSGPKTIKRAAEPKGDKYPVRKTSRKTDDFREERPERRTTAKPYGFDKRDSYERRPERKEAMPFTRKPYAPASHMPETHPRMAAPSDNLQPVQPYKLKKGLEAAREDINKTIEAIANTLADCYNVIDVELAVSFDADGKFLGFGPGGAATIKIRISRTDL